MLAYHLQTKPVLLGSDGGVHVNLNRGVGQKMHQVEHLDVRCSLHVNVHRTV